MGVYQSVGSVLFAACFPASASACVVPGGVGMQMCSPCGSESVEAASAIVPESHISELQGQAISVAPARSGLSETGLPGGVNAGGGGSVVTVHVFGFDFSTNPSGGPIVDPVINVGDTVHWVFDSSFHTATSVAGSVEPFDSGTIFTTGATFDHTFTHAGTFPYICTIHGFDAGGGNVGGMAGFVTVRAVPEPVSLLAVFAPLAIRRRR